MNRRRKIIVVALVLVLVLALCALLIPSGPRDPIYDGKRLSYWLEQQWIQDRANTNSGRVVPALRPERVDSTAIPYLAQAFATSDSSTRVRFAEFWPHLPGWLQVCLPKPRDTTNIRNNALIYLDNLRAYDSPLALPEIASALENGTDKNVRADAAAFLGMSQSRDPAVIRALVHGVKDPDRDVRWYSTNSLRRLDPAALTNAMSK
jgi:hypothetical protein